MGIPAVLTVLGEDKVGIVAKLATALADSGASIKDIRQSILDGIFSMTMLVQIDESVAAFNIVQERVSAVGDELGVQTMLQREDVFRYMFRV